MDTVLFPLARPASGSGTTHLHRRPVPLPGVGGRLDDVAAAGLAALLHHYTRIADVTLGVTTAQGTGVASLRVEPDTVMGDLLGAVTAAAPLTTTTTPLGAVAHDPLTLAGTPGTPGASLVAPAPVTVLVGPAGLELVLSDAQFPAEAADQYAQHLSRILTAAAADPAIRVGDLPLLDEADLQRILVEWNDTDGEVPTPFFHERIAELARRTPEAVAVGWPGGTLTFAGLDDAADRLAHHLVGLGVQKGERVAVCFDRGPESLIAQLACFKLGAPVVLLDPSFPADRLQFMITDAGSVAVLTTSADADKVRTGTPVLNLDTDAWQGDPRVAVAPVVVPLEADDLIHVCYTSGSTGMPKAVLVPHGACRTLIHSMAQACGITAESRGTWLAAPGYGMVQVECFTVLAAGAPVFIPEPSVVTSPQWLRDWLVDQRVTHTLLMKAMAERLWTQSWPAHTALRNIRVCGERVSSWPSPDLPFHLFNLYGSAEATVVATCDMTALGESLGEQGRATRLPPIGRPTVNVKMYVLDEALRPVPPGVTGELCIAGESLSVGYLNRPEATAEKWVTNPFDSQRYPRLYRTGDQARYQIDGSIEIVGRTDNQIKVRGNRVHLGEIEVATAALPGVRQVVVFPHRDEHGDVQLVAYIEPDEGVEPAVPDIRRALQNKLPTFMVPVAYVVDSKLPLTTNGKIDRANLPEPPRIRPQLDIEYTAPRGDTEQTLAEIWSAALGIEGIGVLDNFFELGGDSLRAARLIEDIRTRFQLEAEVEDLFDELFDKPSIERMALAVNGFRD